MPQPGTALQALHFSSWSHNNMSSGGSLKVLQVMSQSPRHYEILKLYIDLDIKSLSVAFYLPWFLGVIRPCFRAFLHSWRQEIVLLDKIKIPSPNLLRSEDFMENTTRFTMISQILARASYSLLLLLGFPEPPPHHHHHYLSQPFHWCLRTTETLALFSAASHSQIITSTWLLFLVGMVDASQRLKTQGSLYQNKKFAWYEL